MSKHRVEQRIFTAIGLMSGTSMDGIDIALITSDGEHHVGHGPNMFVPYEERFRERIITGLNDALVIKERAERPGTLVALEQEITELHINAVRHLMDKNALLPGDIDVIGFHGQTLLHRPREALTVQLGKGQAMADALGIDVVFDLRAEDMMHGGQGAPLVPVYHRALANSLHHDRKIRKPVAFVNIGGISNVTFVGNDGELIAFDCGPGNGLIDQWVQQQAGKPFDEDGNIARTGKINHEICDKYLAHPYFALPVPKSLDRNDFPPLADKTLSPEDGARSLAHVTARAIMRSSAYFPQKPETWIICGGGTLNNVIMDDLRELAASGSANVVKADDLGLDSMALEAEAFGYLAIRSMLGLDITCPTTTGCKAPVSGGRFAHQHK